MLDASLQSAVLVGVVEAVSLSVALAVQGHVSIRRARDRDVRSIAFWVYAATRVATSAMIFGIFVMFVSGVSLPSHLPWLWLPLLVAFGWAAIELGARPGDPMANRWGPPPKPLFDLSGARANNYKPPRS